MDWMKGDVQRPGTLHRYVYALNRPTTVTDPSGNEGVDSLPNYAVAIYGPAFYGKNFNWTLGARGKLNVFANFAGSVASLDASLSSAVSYLQHSYYANTILGLLANGPEVDVTGITGPSWSCESCDPPEIKWDPHYALEERSWDNDHGRFGRQSPAVVLVHEIIHVVNHVDPASDQAGSITDGWERVITQNLRDMGFGEKPREAGAWPDGTTSYFDTQNVTAYWGGVWVQDASDTE